MQTVKAPSSSSHNSSSISNTNSDSHSTCGQVRGKVSALMLACHFCNTRVVNRLLARGADIFVMDEHGDTALDYACKAMERDGVVNRRQVEELIVSLQKAALATKKHRDALQSIAAGDAKDNGSSDDNITFGINDFAGASMENDESSEYVYDIFSSDNHLEMSPKGLIRPVPKRGGITGRD